jgi:hypothetical protein
VSIEKRKVLDAAAPVDEELEGAKLAKSRRFREILARSYKSIEEGRSIPHDEFWKRLAEASRKRRVAARRKSP